MKEKIIMDPLTQVSETIVELDPKYSHDLEQCWREQMQPSIDNISQAY